ncbi:polyprenol reductase 2-like [Telopea speciosissima]|uniref:polyprenol reductase 2-like n=1 Tax=Telopea speciosissima TaxID=54955 RepID=UPI001CC526A2|nr:polyprenol reductase 2-like [Telopea speciosissima]
MALCLSPFSVFPIRSNSCIMEIELESLLRAAWIAAILPILVASLPCARLSSFHRLVLTFASRGKVMPSSSRIFTVPQRFFLHFYVVAVPWTTVLLLMTWFYAYWMVPFSSESFHYSTVASHLTGGSHIFSMHKPPSTPLKHRYRIWKTLFLLLLMEVQVLRRLYETVHVFNYSPSARMHILGYLTGIFFYAAAPLSLCSICVPEVLSFAAHHMAEFIVNGRDHMPKIEFDWWGYMKPLTKLGWCQWIGAAIFIWGGIHQSRCHSILGSLREDREKSDEYVIPHGDWFEFVSSPHYLSEMVIYAGILVASGGSELTIWLLFGFVVANLTFAAAETHRWYLQKFDNYPRNRHAILPYIY